MVSWSLICLLALPVCGLGVPTPTPYSYAKSRYATKPNLAHAQGYKQMQAYGYAPGGMGYQKYGGAYGTGFPYGGAGLVPYGAGVNAYGLGTGHYYGKSAGYGLGAFNSGKLGYNPLYMLQALKTYRGAAGGYVNPYGMYPATAGGYVNPYGMYPATAGGYVNPYGMYPALGKHYNTVATQFPANLGSGGLYGKYAGGAYVKQPGLAYSAQGPFGQVTSNGGKRVGGYGPVGYSGSVVQGAKQVLPGYGSVNMLGRKALTTYG